MHRTLARPAPLDFRLPPSHSIFYGIGCRKDTKIIDKPSQFATAYLETPTRGRLRTPPADDMATAYQQAPYNGYGSRSEISYPTSVSSANGYAGAYSGSNDGIRHYSVTSQAPASALRNGVQVQYPPYMQPTSPQPANKNALAPPEDTQRRKSANSDMILPNLQIPSSINNSGGSLAEFAAQITCLFWFEPTETLKKAENLTPSSSPVKRLREEAIPSSGFRKWVVTILSTTQVTQNVILLALMFIYRLKTINPTVKGRTGSQYRLLTVALMLGNKFLDDNTYTNKTWAEVSGISVTEIHVMEVEFLSNMRYSLFASEEQWKEWQQKLSKFWTYCDAASRAPLPHPSPSAVSLLNQNLPSPPSSMQASPPSTKQYPPSSGPAYSQNWNPTLSSPLPPMPDLESHARKRSYEGEVEEPPAKRVTRPHPSATMPSFNSMPPLIRQDAPRLPVPNLTISTSQPYGNNLNGQSVFAPNAPVLPPLNGRAMATVYPSTPTWTPQLPVPTPTGPSSQSGQHSVNGNGYTTPSRRHSPHSVHDLLSLGSSPITANFPNHNSPSFYLQQRASPYKPVRHVNTLLYPPPSASMHDYSMSVDQMHYQPLGKRHDYRPGLAYPPYSQWPTLPQPNFHA
ncbi:cyclin-domain-containing protein [Bisporella sp. PMI_857]|nr:cyclin-domain-containing protein [Bisporella sp. PMI_857]